jgi:hypothetical protein
MEKNKASNSPLLYRLRSNFHMQETLYKKLRINKESVEEKNNEDVESDFNCEFFSAKLHEEEVVQKLRNMLGDKLTDEVEKELLAPWFDHVDKNELSLDTTSFKTDNREESLLEEQ